MKQIACVGEKFQPFQINYNTDHEPITVHASGHASGPEILEMIRKIKPKQLYPVHTEKPQAFIEPVSDSVNKVILPEKGSTYTYP